MIPEFLFALLFLLGSCLIFVMARGFDMKCLVCDKELQNLGLSYVCAGSKDNMHTFSAQKENIYDIGLISPELHLEVRNRKVTLITLNPEDEKGFMGANRVAQLNESVIEEYIIPKRFDELKEYLGKIINFQ